MPPFSPEHRHFSTAFAHSLVGMALVGLRGHWLDVNPALCHILGYTRAQLLGGTFQDLTHPEDLATDLGLMARTLAGEIESYHLEKRYRHADGRLVWAMLTVTLARDGDGRPECFVSQVIDLSAQKAAQEERDSFFYQSSSMLAIADTEGRFLQLNPAWTEVLGWTTQELLARPYIDWVHPDDVARTLAAGETLRAGGVIAGFRNRYRHADGGWRWLEWGSHTVRDGRLYCTVRDVTRQVEDEEALRSQEEKIRLLIDGAHDAFIGMSEDGVITEWNKQAELTFGWAASEAIGRPMDELIAPPRLRQLHLDGMRAFLARSTAPGYSKRTEVPALRRDGREILVEFAVGMVPHRGRRYFYAFLRDVSEQRRYAERMHYQATHDFLTGLPNRYEFMGQLARAVDKAARHAHALALLFIDLDGFKAVNDQCGHEAGDAVLTEFGARLGQAVRRSDLVARLAGDEFVVMLEESPNMDREAREVAQRILAAAAQPYPLPETCPAIGASIGIALYGAGDSADALLSRADTAMYAAKRAGKNRLSIATESGDVQSAVDGQHLSGDPGAGI
ncbi:PAS domain S-box protein [Massilia sp. KIM]|uniref:PAS domain S-box protein n=1 Tax=Massilia sp. KIM TaxID=1955422 RepID=UPI0015C3DE30|nr:PAS domain S-box protein [Massilia sp. KIM]